MAEFFLVRHGQASFGSDNYDQLSSLGAQQSVWLGEYFAERNISFDQIYIGGQVRHRQTAESISQGLGRSLDCIETPGLSEYDFHALYNALGSDYPEIKRLASGDKQGFYKGLMQVLKLWIEDRLTGTVPESWKEFSQRVAAARQRIQQGGGRRVLVVSSGGAIATTASQVLQTPESMMIELNTQIINASFSHYYFNATAVRLASFNNVPHLDRLDRMTALTYG